MTPTTTTTTTNEMPTTTVNAEKKQPRWKWSGSNEPQSYYSHEDDDTGVTFRKKWYDVHDHTNNWHEDNEVYDDGEKGGCN